MGAIQLQAIEKWYDQTPVIKGVDLQINAGEFVVFVGPSGCGKSTLLRLIAGLEESSRGRIFIEDRDVSALPPSGRGLAMVFQSYALYPHMDVRANMGFSLKTAGVDAATVREKVEHAARILQLSALLDRRPRDLSGGQRQRVAIGRAIVRDPTAFLFDEPLSNLDASLRVGMRHELATLHHQLQRTMIYVTHDQVEAMTLADRIVVLQSGLIEQVGSPRELYERPANRFVAQFIGSPKMNLLDGTVRDGRFYCAEHAVLEAPANATALGVRPESLALCAQSESMLSGHVSVVEYLGSDVFAVIRVSDTCSLTVRCQRQIELRVGEAVAMRFERDAAHFFDEQGLRI